MAIIANRYEASNHGHRLVLSVNVDTTARSVLVNAVYTQNDGSAPAADPQRALLNVTLTNGTVQSFNLGPTAVTSQDTGQTAQPMIAPSDGQPGLLNKGDETFTNVPVRSAVDRGGAIDARLEFLGP
jgi:hypothetical protein